MTKISIIIPTYNVQDYLEECLDSIVKQTLKEIEIICVNDGSTDGSLEILKEYAKKDSRIVIISGPNGGYGHAMNKGFDKATGEYIGIVEPDDYIALDMYEDLYRIAKPNDLDFVKADFYRFTTEENGNRHMIYNHLTNNQGYYNRVFKPLAEKECFRFIMNTWSGIYRRDFLKHYNIRHNTTPGASFQDIGFWFQTFIFAERVMFINRPYYRNRRDNPNSSVKAKDKIYCGNREYDYIRDLIKQRTDLWEQIKGIHSLKRLHSYTATINRIAPECKKDYIVDISDEFKKIDAEGAIVKDVFTEKEWNKLQYIMNDPVGYYLTNVLQTEKEKKLVAEVTKAKSEVTRAKSEAMKAKAEINKIKASKTYKVGKVLMYIPSKIRHLLS